jgi:hypothetical protein
MVLNLDAGFTSSYPNVGTNWYDLTKTQNPGVLTNGPTWSNSGMTSAMTFDGTNDYVSLSNSESIRFLGNSPYTLSVLTKLNRIVSEYPGWINRESTVSGLRDGYNLIYTIQGKLPNQIFIFTERFTQGAQQSPGFLVDRTYNLNKWFRIDSVYDGLNLKIFYNGNLMESIVSSGTITNTSKRLEIAVRDFTYNACDISKVNIYNRGLSNSEILQNFYQGPIVTSGLTFAIDAGNLVSYGGTGTTVYDLTTTGVTGTLTNGPTWTYLSGGTFSFDGTDDNLNFSSYPNLTNNFTLSFWFRTTVTPLNYKGIVTTWTASQPSQSSYGVQFKSDGTLEPVRPVGSNWNIITSSTNVANGNWYHCIVVYNTSGTFLYLNSVLNASNSVTDNVNTPLGFRIGSDISGTNNWNGSVSNVQIYNRALSGNEIKQNFEAYRGRFGV